MSWYKIACVYQDGSTNVSASHLINFWGQFVKRFALCYRTVVLSDCPVCLSVCNVGVLWPNGWMDQDETWHGDRTQPWPHCVRWEPSSPKGEQPPQFSAHVCCGQMAGWIKMPLGTEVSLSPGDIVLDGDSSSKKGHSSPPFSAHVLWPNVWMDQDATWYWGRPRLRPHLVRSSMAKTKVLDQTLV